MNSTLFVQSIFFSSASLALFVLAHFFADAVSTNTFVSSRTKKKIAWKPLMVGSAALFSVINFIVPSTHAAETNASTTNVFGATQATHFLVYSVKAAEKIGATRATLSTGDTVVYTAAYPISNSFADIKDQYRWDDAVVVGTINLDRAVLTQRVAPLSKSSNTIDDADIHVNTPRRIQYQK